MCFDIHKHLSDYTKIDSNSLISLFTDNLNYIDEKSGNYFSIGIHPKDISNITASCLKLVDKHLAKPNVLAIGEIGLDKLYPDYEKQKTLFKSLIRISDNHCKPVIIHSVKASSDILHYRKNHIKNPWIIHGFRGKWKLCKQFLNSNCHVSFGAYLATATSNFTEVIKKVPLDHIFFETDDSNIKISDIYKEFAKIRNISLNLLKVQVTENIIRTFGDFNK